MSTFDGNDIFGSGNHRIVVGGVAVQKKRTAFAGVDGVDSLVLGERGRPVRITGQLRGASIGALNTVISTIENDLSGGAATLVDNFSVSYTNVDLDSLRLIGPIQKTSDGTFIVNYEVSGVKLY